MSEKSPRVVRPLSRKKKIIFIIVAVIVFFLFSFAVYFGSVLLRSKKHHRRHPRVVGSVFQADEEYGYLPKPDSVAFFSIRHSKRVPLVFDRYRFRVPVSKRRVNRPYEGGILFLGCSFTLGDAVPAEKTFPYLVGKELDSRGMNAGLSGGGLCQMVMRARKEIPRFKPKYVVVQYSHWLIRRSQRYYRPTAYGKTPGPFYYESGGHIKIHAPVFTTINFDVPIAKYSRKGLWPFTWHVGLPLYAHDDYYTLLTSAKRLLGMIPKPAQSKEALVRFTYREIEKACRAYGAQMLVVKLYMTGKEIPAYGLDDLGYPVVDTLDPLLSGLPEPTDQAWRMKYQFMKGKPPRLVDIHPNVAAHRVIADAIVKKILVLW
ncbi:MAG: hypothetical protein GY940_31160 [bacterium]|nr:hypothetical protein [bacterium]